MLKALMACIAVLSVAEFSLATPLDKSSSSLADGPKKGAGGAPAKKTDPGGSPKKGTAGAPSTPKK